MGASSSAINPTQDFSPRMGGRRLFDMGTSTNGKVRYFQSLLDDKILHLGIVDLDLQEYEYNCNQLMIAKANWS